jgi:hypothetical protein
MDKTKTMHYAVCSFIKKIFAICGICELGRN